ncbi:MAG: hypothetical protein Q9180_000942 [Flavoplaca navasiana]
MREWTRQPVGYGSVCWRTTTTKPPQQQSRADLWFGRCVYESDNDVCDNQLVKISWDNDPLPADKPLSMVDRLKGRGAKIATFHMIAQTENQCEKRGRVYGSRGEIEYVGTMIRVYDFATSEAQVHYLQQAGGGHGGGDDSLPRHHAIVFAAEEARRDRKVIDWTAWWQKKVVPAMQDLQSSEKDVE